MAFILVAVNKSNLADISDYDVEARVNDTVIWRGAVCAHTRSDGWQALVRRILDEADGA